MKSARNIYLAIMSVAGVAIGALTLAYPGLLGEGLSSGFTVLLVISLMADVGLMQLMKGGEVFPLTMESRFAGFFAGLLLYLLMTMLFAASTPAAS